MRHEKAITLLLICLMHFCASHAFAQNASLNAASGKPQAQDRVLSRNYDTVREYTEILATVESRRMNCKQTKKQTEFTVGVYSTAICHNDWNCECEVSACKVENYEIFGAANAANTVAARSQCAIDALKDANDQIKQAWDKCKIAKCFSD